MHYVNENFIQLYLYYDKYIIIWWLPVKFICWISVSLIFTNDNFYCLLYYLAISFYCSYLIDLIYFVINDMYYFYYIFYWFKSIIFFYCVLYNSDFLLAYITLLLWPEKNVKFPFCLLDNEFVAVCEIYVVLSIFLNPFSSSTLLSGIMFSFLFFCIRF